MSDALHNAVNSSSRRQPWNKGKLIGPKPPLRPGHVWSIRTNLQLHGRIRDLALFNLAIDSKLRGCVAIRVDDVAPNGYTHSNRRSGAGRANMKTLVVFVGVALVMTTSV